MSDFWLGIIAFSVVPVMVLGLILTAYFYVLNKYLEYILRIFVEKPLFIIPRGESLPDAEDIAFTSFDGLTLRGCYFRTTKPRKGVILFGLEYGANRWSCRPYCDHLIQNGYDVFAFEPRNQGESAVQPNYDPLQWLTDYEVRDTQEALNYLKDRPDADRSGVGFFGVSKGANAGMVVASRDRYVRCVATDGAFGTYTTMIPYIRKWVGVYNDRHFIHGLLPSWFLVAVARVGVHRVAKERHVHFVHMENSIRRLKRPLLMIHGEADTYIKPAMARELFQRAAGPKSLWIVPQAKHNQAIQTAPEEYQRRVLEFFDLHLGGIEPGITSGEPTSNEITKESQETTSGGS